MYSANQILIKEYKNLSLQPSPCPEYTGRAIQFKTDADLSILLPYINSVIDNAEYFDIPHYIKFKYQGYYCAVYPDKIAAASFSSIEQGRIFAGKLISFLNRIYTEQGNIDPDYKKKKYVPVLNILRILPKTNCGKCGFPTCTAFAAALSSGSTEPNECHALDNPIKETAIYPVYDNNRNLISTVSIDLDAIRNKKRRKKQNEYIKRLNRRTPSGSDEDNRNTGNPYGLTLREIEVLRLMSKGLTNNGISGILSISPHTVKSHVIHIFNKTGINDRTRLAVWAVRNDII